MYGQLTFEDAQKYAREAREKMKAAVTPDNAKGKFCHSCGTGLPEAATYCTKCGVKQ